MKKLVSFENNYVQGRNEYENTENKDVFESITIDGFTEDEYEEGEVVAVVYITMHGDMITDFHNNGCRFNDVVQSLVKESRETLRNDFNAWMGGR